MDAISDPSVETIVMMCSAQVGKTELTLNLAGFHASQDPAPILVVHPTIQMGESWSKDRLAPMLRDTPALRGVVSDAKSRDGNNTQLRKSFPGGHITIAGANSPASLASRPVRILLCDEVDRFPPSAGSEGDPVNLARKRTTTFWNRKIVLVSTPTTAGASRIDDAFQGSDQRRFWVPCPHCGEYQTLRWGQVKWQTDQPETALYHCFSCGSGWTDHDRWAAVRLGEWRAERPFNGTAGFHLNELYSPWVSLAQTTRTFLEARARPEQLKTWVNTALGETWQEKGDAPDWQRLYERRETFPMAEVPAGAWILTAGVDAQKDRLEAYVWAWAPGYESWLIDHRVFDGSPADDGPWDELSDLMRHEYPCADGSQMRINRAGCDTGGQDTAAVYGQIRRLADQRILAFKGADGMSRSAPVSGPTYVDLTLDGRKIRKGMRLWTVGVSHFKAGLYQRLGLGLSEAGGYPAGWVHLPDGIDAEAVKQLVAEQLVTVKDRKGFARQEWRKLRDRNEALDCAVYARAALTVAGSDRYGDGFWTAEMLGREPVGMSVVADEEPIETLPLTTPTAAAVAKAQGQIARRVGRSSYLSRIGR